MKKKFIIILLVLVIILLVPVPFHLKDGGTVEYRSLVYKISKVHKLNSASKTGYTEGIIVELFGIQVFNNVIEDVNVSVDDYSIENITMEIKTGTLTDKGATIIITDTSGKNNIYGAEYKIDKKENSRWKELKPIIDNYGFTSIGYHVDEFNKLELDIDWEWLYGKLESGQYRLVKKVNNQNIAVVFNIDTLSSVS